MYLMQRSASGRVVISHTQSTYFDLRYAAHVHLMQHHDEVFSNAHLIVPRPTCGLLHMYVVLHDSDTAILDPAAANCTWTRRDAPQSIKSQYNCKPMNVVKSLFIFHPFKNAHLIVQRSTAVAFSICTLCYTNHTSQLMILMLSSALDQVVMHHIWNDFFQTSPGYTMSCQMSCCWTAHLIVPRPSSGLPHM